MSIAEIVGYGAGMVLAIIIGVVFYGVWLTMRVDEKDMK